MCVKALDWRECAHHGKQIHTYGTCVSCIREFGVGSTIRPSKYTYEAPPIGAYEQRKIDAHKRKWARRAAYYASLREYDGVPALRQGKVRA